MQHACPALAAYAPLVYPAPGASNVPLVPSEIVFGGGLTSNARVQLSAGGVTTTYPLAPAPSPLPSGAVTPGPIPSGLSVSYFSANVALAPKTAYVAQAVFGGVQDCQIPGGSGTFSTR